MTLEFELIHDECFRRGIRDGPPDHQHISAVLRAWLLQLLLLLLLVLLLVLLLILLLPLLLPSTLLSHSSVSTPSCSCSSGYGQPKPVLFFRCDSRFAPPGLLTGITPPHQEGMSSVLCRDISTLPCYTGAVKAAFETAAKLNKHPERICVVIMAATISHHACRLVEIALEEGARSRGHGSRRPQSTGLPVTKFEHPSNHPW